MQPHTPSQEGCRWARFGAAWRLLGRLQRQLKAGSPAVQPAGLSIHVLQACLMCCTAHLRMCFCNVHPPDVGAVPELGKQAIEGARQAPI